MTEATIPEGMVLVPREPTEAMVQAWHDSIGDPDVFATWSAMLAAAQPAGDRGEREGG